MVPRQRQCWLTQVLAGAAPIEIKRGLDKVAAGIVAELEESKRPVESLEDVRHIATISANNDRVIGDIIATAIDKAVNDGSVQIEEARSELRMKKSIQSNRSSLCLRLWPEKVGH